MSLDTVERALAEFYCNQNVEVHKILLDFQNSIDAWNLVWDMLDTSKVRLIIYLSRFSYYVTIKL